MPENCNTAIFLFSTGSVNFSLLLAATPYAVPLMITEAKCYWQITIIFNKAVHNKICPVIFIPYRSIPAYFTHKHLILSLFFMHREAWK